MAAMGVALHATHQMAHFPPQGNDSSWINTSYIDLQPDQPAGLDVSDYITFDDHPAESSTLAAIGQRERLVSSVPMMGSDTGLNNENNFTSGGSSSSSREREGGVKKMKMDDGLRIGFRTKSEVEILDDGFKWRKYGKKSVKNSPNPRNYYRCSTEGCSVKKRVERDREDSSYVVTTYEGVHNHMSPSAIYYTSHDSTSGGFVINTRPSA